MERHPKGPFTWSGGPRSSGVGFFCFHALGDTKQKKRTPLDRGPPLHVNRVLDEIVMSDYNSTNGEIHDPWPVSDLLQDYKVFQLWVSLKEGKGL